MSFDFSLTPGFGMSEPTENRQTMNVNESKRFAASIRARAKLKMQLSALAIQQGEWLDVSLAAQALAVGRDLGDFLKPPDSVGRCRPCFEDYNSPEAIAANEAIDREREAWEQRCRDFDEMAASIPLPPLQERENLDGEVKEVDEKLAEVPDNVVLLGLRAWLIGQSVKLNKRISSTVPRSFLVDTVETVNRAIERHTGIPQNAALGNIANGAQFIRSMGARADQ